MKRVYYLFLCIILLLIYIPFPTVYASSDEELSPQLLDTDNVSSSEILLYSQACVIMDIETGTIIYYKNMDDVHYPASTTKILTTLLALENGNLSDTITFSENAINSITSDSTNIGLSAGEQLTLEQTLYAVMLESANEAANGAAEYVSGSVTAFAEKMNAYAADIGCKSTHFTNANGLHDDNHYTTAYDLALIASKAAKNPIFLTITGTNEYVIPGTNLRSGQEIKLSHHHKMLNGTIPYEGVYSGKTGYTKSAGITLVTYANRDYKNLVCVILSSPGSKYAYQDTQTALDYSFNIYDTLNIEAINTAAAVTKTTIASESMIIEETEALLSETSETSDSSLVLSKSEVLSSIMLTLSIMAFLAAAKTLLSILRNHKAPK